MEIIRVIEETKWNEDKPKEDSYIIMNINWFREQVWVVSKKKNVKGYAMNTTTHYQKIWDGVEDLLKGIEHKHKTQNPVKKTFGDDGLLVIRLGPQEQDYSKYETVRWFPKLRGIWPEDNTFIRDLESQDMKKYFPEYLI